MSIDKRALKLFFQKDEKTVSYFYHAYWKLLYFVSYDILKVKEDAEEVVQETFLNVLEKGKEENLTPESFPSYLCKISSNLSISRLRKSSPYLPLEENLAGTEENKDQGELLTHLKSILNENEYKLLLYRLYAELDFKTIASIMEISPSAARGIYHRAIKKAKQNLNKEEWV